MLRAISVVILTGAIYASQWDFFYPQTVTKYGCRVELVDVRPRGSATSYGEEWEAIAWAKRTQPEPGDWAMKIGEFPGTNKGRHQAEKTCSQWQDVAESKVNPRRAK